VFKYIEHYILGAKAISVNIFLSVYSIKISVKVSNLEDCMRAKPTILSTGSYLPENIVFNDDLKQFPAGILKLIRERTGVEARRFANDSQCTSDLGIIAAQRCLAKVDFDSKLIDAIILATSSPDRIQPASATRIQHQIGASEAFAFDINSVCSGSIYALEIANSLITVGRCKNILVIGAEVYSKFIDPKDFSTYPYFGDGAGAVLLSASSNADSSFYSILKSDGAKADIIQIPAGGTMLPYLQIDNPKDVYFRMVGREVYAFAISKGSEIIEEVINKTGTNKDDIEYVIPHQANINIIKDLSRLTQISVDKFIVNLDKYGNTAAASVLIALDELIESNKLKRGDFILMVAFGGGVSWGANVIRY
jgi:3-oxoacyl-[acyl-carrier-protein] synthase III